MPQGIVSGHPSEDFSVRFAIGHADLHVAVPVVGVGKDVEFVDCEIVETAVAQGIAFLDSVEPSDHPLSARGSAKFKLGELSSERVVFRVNSGEEEVRTDLRVVDLAATDDVNGLRRNACGEEQLGSRGVRSRNVGGEPMSLVQWKAPLAK